MCVPREREVETSPRERQESECSVSERQESACPESGMRVQERGERVSQQPRYPRPRVQCKREGECKPANEEESECKEMEQRKMKVVGSACKREVPRDPMLKR